MSTEGIAITHTPSTPTPSNDDSINKVVNPSVDSEKEKEQDRHKDTEDDIIIEKFVDGNEIEEDLGDDLISIWNRSRVLAVNEPN